VCEGGLDLSTADEKKRKRERKNVKKAWMWGHGFQRLTDCKKNCVSVSRERDAWSSERWGIQRKIFFLFGRCTFRGSVPLWSPFDCGPPSHQNLSPNLTSFKIYKNKFIHHTRVRFVTGNK
jgi:hypothetical protein